MRSRPAAVTLRLMLAAGLAAPAPACTRWRVEQLPPAQLIEQNRPGKVQLRRHDGERLVLKRPWVDGDSLAGLHDRDTTRVAVADVSTVAVRRFGPLETLGLTAFTVGALALTCAIACDFGTIGFGY
ncbi:MAG TPA: hypothetical protein VEB59_00305 [Gemmatimonadales bacterium]|nr:hypothetical protein [Gemmatimonadales bacterium]